MKKECTIRLVEFGAIKALVSVTYGDLEIKGFKVMDQGGEPPWVAMPSREFQKNGDRQFFNIIFIPDQARRKEFTDWIIQEYKNACANPERAVAAGSRNGSGGGSGAGPGNGSGGNGFRRNGS